MASMTTIRSRGRRTVVALSVALALVALAPVASAMPGDPPISALSPASGASVPATDRGIKVSFACPDFSTDVEIGAGGERNVPGSLGDYGVRVSTSAVLGPGGLLTTAGFGPTDGNVPVKPAGDGVTCGAELSLPGLPIPAPLFSGTIYWQPFRLCPGCGTTGFEPGPVVPLVITPNIQAPELSFEAQVYAGYMTKVTFSTLSNLAGARVVLQSWNGTEWQEVGNVSAGAGKVSFFVKLKAPALVPLRAALTAPGVFFPLLPRLLNVLPPATKRAVDAKDDGRYLVVPKRERSTAPGRFRITHAGKLLEGLKATVPATCTSGADTAPTTATVALRRARIAPDGTVIGKATTHGATPAVVTLAGRLHDRHFSGELTTTFLNCTGTRNLEADLVGKMGGSGRKGGSAKAKKRR